MDWCTMKLTDYQWEGELQKNIAGFLVFGCKHKTSEVL